jgi:hypothetical protein
MVEDNKQGVQEMGNNGHLIYRGLTWRGTGHDGSEMSG